MIVRRQFFLKLLPVLLLFFIWLYFRQGSLTEIAFKINQQGTTAQAIIDNQILGNFTLDQKENTPVIISADLFPTFTQKSVKQKIINYFIKDKAELIPKDGHLVSDFNALKSKTIGVKINNLEQARVDLNFRNDYKISLHLRPLRENDWVLAETKNSLTNFIKVSRYIPLNPWQQFKKIGQVLTLPFPLLILLLLYIYLTKSQPFKLTKSHVIPNKFFINTPIILVSLLIFFWFFYLNQNFLDGIPHVGDAVTYLMQSKFIASGKICGTPPIPPNIFEFFKGWGPLYFQNGRWCGYFPYGHPLMLSIGVLLNNPGIIPPLLAAASIIFIFLIGRLIANNRIGIFAALIVFVSPFFQMNASSFMSHNTALFYEVVGLYFLLKGVLAKNNLLLILSALFFGLLFNTRSLTAVGLAFPLFIYLLLSKVKFSQIFLFFSSWFLFASTYFLNNYLTFGHPWKTPYLENNIFLFTPGKNLLVNYVLSFQTHLLTYLTSFHGWPYLVSALLLFFTLLVCRSKELVLLFLSVLGITLIWSIPDGGTYAITYGPRYWFEIIPFVALIFSLSIYGLINLSQNKYYQYLMYFNFFCLLAFTFIGWVRGQPILWRDIGYTPAAISELKSFNNTDARLIKTAKQMAIKNAVIFVKDCDGNWWCYGSVLPQNNPNLNSDILWASDLGFRNQELINFYSSRQFYLADYDQNEIVAY